MDIHGRVEVERSPNLEEQHRTERKEDASHQTKAYYAVIVGASLTAVYVLLTFCLLRIAQRTYNIQERAYIGVDSISVAQGINQLNFTVQVKNFGPVPGTNYIGRWKVLMDGVEQPGNIVEDKPATFFPGHVVTFDASVGNLYYPDIIAGKRKVVFEVTVEYDTPTGRYKECSKHQFSPSVGKFMNLGAC